MTFAHRCPNCDDTAFHYKEGVDPKPGQSIRASMIQEDVKAGQPIQCLSCGETFDPHSKHVFEVGETDG